VTVSTFDQYGHPKDNDFSEVTLSLVGGSGSLQGITDTTLDAGVYVFSVSIDLVGTYTIIADVEGFHAITSPIMVVPGGLDHITAVESATQVYSDEFFNVTVSAWDASNNLLTNDMSDVIISVSEGPGQLIIRTSDDLTNGDTVFHFAISEPGDYVLTAHVRDMTADTHTIEVLAVSECDENCEECEGDGTCYQCEAGYEPNAFGVCISCTSGQYSSDGLVCVFCDDGYFSSNGITCEAMDPNFSSFLFVSETN